MLLDRYIVKNLLMALLFITIALTGVVFLSQSLRFLEMVMESGASSVSFWILTSLALPRFFEIILPISLMASTLFIYNKMAMDSELVVMRSAGLSPMSLARPALVISSIITLFLWLVTAWIAPASLWRMHEMSQEIKAHYSSMIFREGVFNNIGDDLTVYVRNRTSDGELQGIMIYDSRPENNNPVTVISRRGRMVTTEDGGQQVLVYDGSRQEFEKKKRAINKLDFDRYAIDFPASGTIRKRWKEADERTMWELLNPDLESKVDMDNRNVFLAEAHRRIISPLLALAYTLIALVCLLIGPVDRRGMGKRMALGAMSVVVLQGLFLSASNFAKYSMWGLLAEYLLVLVPLGLGYYLLCNESEIMRRRILFSNGKGDVAA